MTRSVVHTLYGVGVTTLTRPPSYVICIGDSLGRRDTGGNSTSKLYGLSYSTRNRYKRFACGRVGLLSHQASTMAIAVDESRIEEAATKETPQSTSTSSPPNETLSDAEQPESMASPEATEPPFKPGRSFVLAFASICVITLAAALDATSLSIALPIITDRLRGTAVQAFWSGTSFLVASAVIQPVVGGLSHAFGRKEVY